MTKTNSSPKDQGQPQTQAGSARPFYSVHPWESRHHSDHSEIVAYVEASGAWETVLDVRQTSGASHDAMAASILALIHEHHEKRNALRDAIEALELVLKDGMTFSSEQAAERAVDSIKKVIAD
jgi:pyridoxal/pyridoxine/pyridoxamine kinase